MEIHRGRFHQTLCTKWKIAGLQWLAKKFPIQFCQLWNYWILPNNLVLNFANILSRHLPNTIRQKKLLILFSKKSRSKILVKSTLSESYMCVKQY